MNNQSQIVWSFLGGFNMLRFAPLGKWKQGECPSTHRLKSRNVI
jgi:hypothetical protein